jgi:hypothetical protein
MSGGQTAGVPPTGGSNALATVAGAGVAGPAAAPGAGAIGGGDESPGGEPAPASPAAAAAPPRTRMLLQGASGVKYGPLPLALCGSPTTHQRSANNLTHRQPRIVRRTGRENGEAESVRCGPNAEQTDTIQRTQSSKQRLPQGKRISTFDSSVPRSVRNE